MMLTTNSDNFTEDYGLGPWFRAEKIRESLAEIFFLIRNDGQSPESQQT